MSEVCRFAGIIISIYHDEHGSPHFHARYAEHLAKIDIVKLTVIRGYLPLSQLHVLLDWAKNHQTELLAAWNLARMDESPGKINP